MHTRTKKLRQLMKDHDLTAVTVGGIVGRTHQTVRTWRMESTPRPIPKNTLRLLELELLSRKGRRSSGK